MHLTSAVLSLLACISAASARPVSTVGSVTHGNWEEVPGGSSDLISKDNGGDNLSVTDSGVEGSNTAVPSSVSLTRRHPLIVYEFSGLPENDDEPWWKCVESYERMLYDEDVLDDDTCPDKGESTMDNYKALYDLSRCRARYKLADREEAQLTERIRKFHQAMQDDFGGGAAYACKCHKCLRALERAKHYEARLEERGLLPDGDDSTHEKQNYAVGRSHVLGEKD
ncbi:hypothetical protein QFC20_006541 [Naganishia adeliensis]|uniref:Uncharacterized protein n=1 Tax=Naganishia adeliensis TaxID=92952 RepID=A0ACC2VA23_9TREE|nr:hypothetical protein QFC20_006541 [Naganishia adeliensis]